MNRAGSAHEIDYSVINLSSKWKILRRQWRFALWSLWISIGSFMLGFDYVAGGQLAALPVFKQQFGVQGPDGSWFIPARYLSAWNAIGPVFEFVSAILAAPFFERYGRRPMIFVSVLFTTVGVLMQQLSREWTLHLGGRAVNGFAIGIMFTICPLYLGENSRPELRGFMLCFFNTSIVIGQFLIVLVSRGSETLDNIWQWETVIAVQYIWPLLLIVGVWWFPESPYWLIREGDPDKARRALQKLYGRRQNSDAFFDIEMDRLTTDVRVTQDLTGAFEIRTVLGMPLPTAELECFKGKNFKRTFTAIWAASAQQMIGATFVIGYATYFFDLIGFKNYFDASVVLYVCMVLSTCAAFYFVEVAGRRTLLVWPGFILTFLLLIIGISGSVPDKKAGSWAIIVFTYLWAIVYQLSIGATGFVLASEVATMRLRAATQSLVTAANAVWGLIMQFTIPYMINPDAGNLGGKTGYIFSGLGLIASIGGYVLYPETKGISFERIDQLYLAGVPPRHFSKYAHQEDFGLSNEARASDLKSDIEAVEVVKQ